MERWLFGEGGVWQDLVQLRAKVSVIISELQMERRLFKERESGKAKCSLLKKQTNKRLKLKLNFRVFKPKLDIFM